ncbi:MAG: hypothetical protein ABI229_03420 [Gemmatimonadaceae bacterium]
MTSPNLSIVVTNARIRTGDPRRPWATALGIRDGTLAVVGMAAEILKMVDSETNIIDASGSLLELPHEVGVGSRVTIRFALDGSVTFHTCEAC